MTTGGWNYRVLRCEDKGEPFYTVHEVYYDEAGKPDSWTEDPVGPHGESQADLLHGLRLFLAAWAKPILIVRDDKIVGEEKWK